MKILIDECLDWRICRSLPDYHCVSLHKTGWAGLKNGELLERAQNEFDVFITSDRNLAFQQNTSKFRIGIIVLCAKSTRLNDTLSLMPEVAELLHSVQPGEVVQVFGS
jgi:predicted nuclease of predicted toxin-antitoxin system